MRPGQLLAGLVFSSGFCVLATLRMAIRSEADSQKAVAIDAGIDESQFARKLNGKEPMTFRDLEKLPAEVRRAFHLEELSQLGLPERAKRWLKVARELNAHGKKSA